jgi:hypothetical protein
MGREELDLGPENMFEYLFIAYVAGRNRRLWKWGSLNRFVCVAITGYINHL